MIRPSYAIKKEGGGKSIRVKREGKSAPAEI